jgi:hypothetical protein
MNPPNPSFSHSDPAFATIDLEVIALLALLRKLEPTLDELVAKIGIDRRHRDALAAVLGGLVEAGLAALTEERFRPSPAGLLAVGSHARRR